MVPKDTLSLVRRKITLQPSDKALWIILSKGAYAIAPDRLGKIPKICYNLTVVFGTTTIQLVVPIHKDSYVVGPRNAETLK